jgi:imidazolonepropionase-like amidohydrolase
LTAGKGADFLVLDANPLENITTTRRITRIFLKGREVNRESLLPASTR